MVQIQEDQTERLLAMMEEGFNVPDADPDAVGVGTVVNSDVGESFPAAISEVSHRDPDTGRVLPGTGYRWLFNTHTGEPVKVHRHHFQKALRAKHRDSSYPEWVGKLKFSLTQTKPYVLGTSLCWLHPQRPEGWVKKINGINPCLTAHLANEYEAERHTRLRHKSEWAAIQARIAAEDRDADRKLQQRLVDAQENVARMLAANNRPEEAAPRRRKAS